jgi:branched-chain amino acid transport system substrate-binding protein
MSSKRVRLAAAGATTVAMAVAATGCGSVGGSSAAGSGSNTFTIGFVSPVTGAEAPFGEVNSFVTTQMKDYFASHPLTIGGKKYDVKIIVKDAASDSTKAGQAASDLINSDGVDLVVADGTPDIADPVSEQCEANQIPCITDIAPWQPFAIRSGSKPANLKYSYHFFWGLEDVSQVYQDIWKAIPNNGKAGGLFPDDPDGQAWSANFPSLTKASGVTIDNPGLFPDGTKDFSAQISKFKSENDQVLVGVPTPPDFTTFWKQAMQQGYKPKVATIGKALLFPSSVDALGDVAQNLSSEVWWTPTAPYTSSLTGDTAAQEAAAYTKATGKQWSQPLGYAEALFEVAAAAVEKAGSTDADAIVGALKNLDVKTLVGEVHWGADKSVPPYVAKTPVAGGQWRKVDGTWDLVVVDNKLAPEVPLGGKPEPIS